MRGTGNVMPELWSALRSCRSMPQEPAGSLSEAFSPTSRLQATNNTTVGGADYLPGESNRRFISLRAF